MKEYEHLIGVYEHYKGKQYEVIGIAKHTETLELLVVYKTMPDDGMLWVRPKEMFFGNINHNSQVAPRFKRIAQ